MQTMHPRSLSSLPEFCIQAKYRPLHQQHTHTTCVLRPTLEVCAFLAKHYAFDQQLQISLLDCTGMR